MNHPGPMDLAAHRLVALLAAFAGPLAAAPFAPVWQLGTDNGDPSPFTWESWANDPPPGSPTVKDDDYYFAGSYPGVGSVAVDENPANFEASLSPNDTHNRIRFMLDAAQASASARLRLSIDLIWGSSWSGPGWGNHDITVTMNGLPLGSQSGITWNRTLVFTVPAASVNAVAGANMIEIRRSGGATPGSIVFDHLKLESEPTGMTDADGDGMPLWYEEALGLDDSNPADASADPDGDGLTTHAEFLGGTNPTDPDSDKDGLSDSAEIAGGTQPLNRDSDGDGLYDGAEILTNPLLADSDGDGHPDNIELEQGSNPADADSRPFDFPGAIGLQFVSEAFAEATLPSGDPAGFFRLPHWNATPGLPEWRDNGVVLNGSLANLKDHRGHATNAAATFSYHFADEGLHRGPSDERLFGGMIRTQRNATINTPVTVSLSGIPYASYDLIVYVGSTYPGSPYSPGQITRNGLPATARCFTPSSAPPFRGFTEISSSSLAAPSSGNFVRYRNLAGATQSITLESFILPVPPPGTPITSATASIHGIQIIDSATDSDRDGLSDSLEIEHRLNPAVSDAGADADGDSLGNAAEIAAGTDPNHRDSDRDGLPDNAEAAAGASPLDPDSDDDGLLDGEEVNAKPFPTLANDADSDDDGHSDKVERDHGSNPLSAASLPPSAPVWDPGTSTWRWRVDHLRVLWNHPQSMLGAINGGDTMLCEAVAPINQGGWSKQIGMGLRYVDGRISHRFRCGEGVFKVGGSVNSGFWGSDGNNPPADRMRDFGLSGHGELDDSKPLRLEFTAVRAPSGANSWTLTFLIADLTVPASPVTLASQTWTNAFAVDSSLMAGNTPWTSAAGVAGRFDLAVESGVQAFIAPAPLGPPDADSDGMPDDWEDTHAFLPNSAADAPLDADGDGLSNVREFLAGTHPRDADSDDDGVPDGTELGHGSDPLSATSKPAWFHFAGSVSDLDGDGLSDAWTLWSGGIPRVAAADDDGDGMSNLEESEAGTDPDDAASKLDLNVWRSGGDLVLSWTDLPLKSQHLQTSGTLGDWENASGLPASTVGGGRRQLVLPSATLPPGRHFYRSTASAKDSDGDGVEDWTEELVLGSSNSAAGSLGQPLLRANGQTLSGDAAALIDRIQGSAPNGGTPGGSGPGSPSPVNAARFLMQSTFGPVPDAIAEVRQLGFAAWIDQQLALPPSYLTPYIREIKADAAGPRIDPTYNYSTQDKFIFGNNATTPFARNAVGAPDQLRQRVAFALSQILVVSRRDANLEEKPEAITHYYDTLLRHAFGNYGDLLFDVALHPAMGVYLSHAGNQKADPSIPRYPDENFAREITQLFTIGLWELHPDGSRKLDSAGEPIPTYDNGDVTELARVFTGLYYASPYGWGGGGWADEHFTRPMVMHPDRHDFEAKRLPGGRAIPAREPGESNGMQDVRDAVDALFRHPNTPPFISRQLIQFLVTDNPSPAYIRRVQDVFVNDGSGTRGNLGAVVKAILLDPEARAQPTADSWGKVREPVVRTMHLGRLLKLAKTHPRFVWWNWTENYYGSSKQEPMNSPSVFNFYTPVYQAPGEIRNTGLVSPGFQIVDTYSSISFPNLLWSYLHEGFHAAYNWRYPLDYSAPLLLAENPAALVDHVDLLVCAGTMTARTRGILLTALANPTLSQKERVALAYWTALTCPEGTVQR
jgi:uncharacterized protein (DUF1800 family)